MVLTVIIEALGEIQLKKSQNFVSWWLIIKQAESWFSIFRHMFNLLTSKTSEAENVIFFKF